MQTQNQQKRIEVLFTFKIVPLSHPIPQDLPLFCAQMALYIERATNVFFSDLGPILNYF